MTSVVVQKAAGLCGARQLMDFELEQQSGAQHSVVGCLLTASLCGACQVPDYELEQQALAYQPPAAHAQQQQHTSGERAGESAPGPSVDGSHPPGQQQGAMSFAHWQQQPGAAQQWGHAEQAGPADPAAEEAWQFAPMHQQQV